MNNDRATLRQPAPRPHRGSFCLLYAAAWGLALWGNGPARAQNDEPGQAVQAPPQNPLAGVTFAKWTEPREGAFSVSVPRGWKVDGVLSRVGATDTRQAVEAHPAPVNNMLVVLGDPSLPTFATPTPSEQMRGHGEGYSDILNGAFQRMILHYMPANEFNQWYLQRRVSAIVNNLSIIGEKPDQALSQQLTQAANSNRNLTGGKWHVNVSVGATAFAGTLKETGMPIRGLLLTSTQLLYGDDPRLGGTWHANVNIIGCNDDADKVAHLTTALAVFQRMQSSFAENPVWAAKQIKHQATFMAALQKKQAAAMKAQLAQQRRNARLIAKMNRGGGGGGYVGGGAGGGESASMAAYWRHNAARAENQHQFINYLRDEKDVVDTTTGTRYTVPDN